MNAPAEQPRCGVCQTLFGVRAVTVRVVVVHEQLHTVERVSFACERHWRRIAENAARCLATDVPHTIAAPHPCEPVAHVRACGGCGSPTSHRSPSGLCPSCARSATGGAR